ncbi:MAG: hypothetical protein ACFFAT_16075 [Promethearchaeota archaeon]
MEEPSLDNLKLELREKEKVIEEQARIIEILRESNTLIKQVNKKILDDKDNTIRLLNEKIKNLQRELKKYISLTI